jgi:hypothetical protein
MKKLMIFVMLVVAMSINAQVGVLKAEYAEMTATEDWNDAEYADVSEEGIFINVDLEEGVILITNNFDDAFVIKKTEPYEQQSRGRTQKSLFFTCDDKDGVECYVMASWYPDGSKFEDMYSYRIRVAYSNIWYGYYCEEYVKSGAKKGVPTKVPKGKEI